MTVKLKEPTFEEHHWTGDVAALTTFLELHSGAPGTFLVRLIDGAAYISPISVAVEPGGYLIFGPIRSGNKTQGRWDAYSATDYADQFAPVA